MSEGNLRRLPLWRDCADRMRKQGLTYGQIFEAEFFEEALSCKRNTMEFLLAISSIRRDLESSGFYLSGRGGKGDRFSILPANKNHDQMRSFRAKARDSLRRGTILGTNTRLDELNAEDRAKHEKLLEIMGFERAMMQKSGTIKRYLGKKGKKLIGN